MHAGFEDLLSDSVLFNRNLHYLSSACLNVQVLGLSALSTPGYGSLITGVVQFSLKYYNSVVVHGVVVRS